MSTEETIKKLVDDLYPQIHVDNKTFIGGGDLNSLYKQIHDKLIILGGQDIDIKYPSVHAYLEELILNRDNKSKEYDYVDMGEAGKWATCNVGASSPTESGLYFQWGDTQGYTPEQVGTGEGQKPFSVDWSDYKFYDGEKITKYCTYSSFGTVDNLTVLQPEDDAAHVHMGGDWRMPTQEECQKLGDVCYTEWIENYNNSGVNGTLFTLRTDNSKQLFFPASGICVSGSVDGVGFGCCVWSSSLDSSDPGCSLSMGCFSDDVYVVNGDRYGGIPVRGVLGVGE